MTSTRHIRHQPTAMNAKIHPYRDRPGFPFSALATLRSIHLTVHRLQLLVELTSHRLRTCRTRRARKSACLSSWAPPVVFRHVVLEGLDI